MGVRIASVLGLLVLSLFWVNQPARAQTPIQVSVDRADVLLPLSISFHLTASSSADLQKITLLYGTNAKSCQVSNVRQEMAFSAATDVELTWRWDFARSGSVPPGAQVWWQWEIEDAAGAVLRTEKREMRIQDAHYSWKEIREGNITLEWTEGSSDFARSTLTLATASLDRLTREAGIAPTEAIRIILYPTTWDLQGAILALPGWTGGVAFPQYSVVIIGLAPGQEDWARAVVPHELAHLVTGELTDNCAGGSVPSWLGEGISVYAEGEPRQADLNSLRKALDAGTLTPLSQLAEGFAADAGRADLAYAQSGETVRYLIDAFGPTKSRRLLAQIKTGASVDAALMTVYGFDTTGLDSAWRESMGYAPLPTRPATPVTTRATAIPTLALWVAVSATPQAKVTARPSATALATATMAATATILPTSAPGQATSFSALTVLAAFAALAILALAGWFISQRLRR